MEATFWHNRWQTNQTGWHKRAVNPLLTTHFPSLNVPPGGRVFVPLCGKSLDLCWLLSREILGPVDAVYDRAALVALPEDMRGRYAAHLKAITVLAPQLVIGYEYDQTVVAGPPFSVTADELHRHYSDSYTLTLLPRVEVPGGLKGKCAATEHSWRLNKRPF